MPDHVYIEVIDIRNAEPHQDADYPNGQLERGVNAKRMASLRNKARQAQAAQTHPCHEGSQQYSQGNRGGTDHELEHLKPNDFVNQRGTAAGGEEHQQNGKDGMPGVCQGHGLACAATPVEDGGRATLRRACRWVKILFTHMVTAR